MKKFKITALVTVLLVVSIISAITFAGCSNTPGQTNNNPNDNLVFIEQSDGTYGVKTTNKNIEGALIIPATYNDKPVSIILENGFMDCKKLTSVVIPNGIKSIEKDAFLLCTSLNSVTIYPSIQEIKFGAFRSCGDFDLIHKGAYQDFNYSVSSGTFMDSNPNRIYQPD